MSRIDPPNSPVPVPAKAAALLQAAARAVSRVDDPNWRPDLDDDQALELANQIGAQISIDLIAGSTTVTHKASGTSVSESTADDRAGAVRLAILRLAASLAPLN